MTGLPATAKGHAPTAAHTLTPGRVDAYAACALTGIERTYPFAMQRVMRDAGDRPTPHEAHPVFHGCYDWHSCVHMLASLLTLARIESGLDAATRRRIETLFAHRFTAAHAAVELAHLQAHPAFERPYGWAWLLRLHDELRASRIDGALAWRAAIDPLADFVVARWRAHLAIAPHPHRAGTHTNSAFAMTLALRHARAIGNVAFAADLRAAAQRWYGDDRRYPARFEPSANDFLSPGLCSAVLMSEALDAAAFADWWRAFEPSNEEGGHWLRPVVVGSRSDPQLVHADGLNLSRAWCLGLLAGRIGVHRDALRASRQLHLAAALPFVTQGDFVATHWLVSFAVLALTEGGDGANGRRRDPV